MRWEFLLALMLIIGCNLGQPPRRANPEFAKQYEIGADAMINDNLEEAEKAFLACLEIDPGSVNARMQLSRVYIKQQKFDEASATLDRLDETFDDPELLLSPEELAEAYVVMSQIHSYQGEFSEATDDLANALELDPRNLNARMRLGYFLGAPQQMLVPDLAASKRQFEKVLKEEPNHLEAMLQLGLAEFRLGEADKAAERFRNIIENYGRHAGAYYYLGVYYLRQAYLGAPDAQKDNAEEAVNNLKASIHLKSSDLDTVWNLYTAARLAGYGEEVLDAFRPESRQDDWQEHAQPENPRFTDVAPDLEMDKTDGGRGSAWADYDADGDLDIVAVGTYQPHALYRNNGDGTFTNVAKAARLADPRGGWGSLFADYNNDGYPDLYVTRGGWSGAADNTLYHNNGNGTFTDVTRRAGVRAPQSSFCAAWADYDNDGYLDLYIANGVIGDGAANVLYRNNGDGTFTDVAEEAGVANTGSSLGTAWGDYNNDGYIDVHVVNYGEQNILYRNNGDGTFTDVTSETGMDLTITDAFVTFFLDYDNDSDLDIFISNSGSYISFITSQFGGEAVYEKDRQVLYRNNGDGTFTDVTKEAGLSWSFGAMGANFGDIDGDGNLDIYLATGAPQMGRLERDALFHNNGDGTFTDRTIALGLGNLGKGHGVTFGDADADGDQDIYVSVGGAFIGDQWPNLFYRNQGPVSNWLTVKPVGIKSNRDGIGARVTLTIGERTLYREVSGGCGFGSTNSIPLEIGLGDATVVDKLEIVWPSGQVDTYENLSVNQTFIATEGESLKSPSNTR